MDKIFDDISENSEDSNILKVIDRKKEINKIKLSPEGLSDFKSKIGNFLNEKS